MSATVLIRCDSSRPFFEHQFGQDHLPLVAAEQVVIFLVPIGVCQSSCRLVSFSGCLFGWPGHGSAAASLMGERVGGPMTFAPGIGAFRVQPDRGDGLPVARLA